MKPLLEVNNLRKTFPVPGSKDQRLIAVDDVSFTLNAGETLGLVGESGCGKSTTGRTILNLLKADSGQVLFSGVDLQQLSSRQLKPYRRKLQMIFQDPISSLNPRMTVGDILQEPLQIHRLARKNEQQERIVHLLEQVGLGPEHVHRYPHEFSGGQRQRIGIARAIAVEPQLIVADEPVSALDLSIQAQILNLLRQIQQQYELSYLFVAHDLAVIEHISDRVAVMYLGRIVELTTAKKLYKSPRHPYSEILLNAVPVPDPKLQRKSIPLIGEPPSPVNPPPGCHFHPRCPYAQEICQQQRPGLTDQGDEHLAACHFSDQVGRYLKT
ncbi:MAG TPA: oligopeptide/dipeptide ABC transporter ATP-binding protein [Geopsychrobacteraceae bacterium]|nr:oligopeptide/dipeptide ABC transporter ATP-binding protein [Geopsychrobacteraceae bacterium]